ncbi:GNAT family N-acetyltransferase [Novosphingobium sp. AP12]|uniref:GNAT family N-acetyltransferase n=1 Tax=Novosphingobium sp. AP12 TaxID=1144305 RepID=UPI0002720081|nr:GNAT family N-acetyltransferase [Novosphingobium sp. AP12]EJL24125.1 acetyltransferase, ribosomal protein N-acetylase [Novosphingobium sp. AP12]
MFIRSERLFLRPGWSEDWEELLTLIADEAIVHNLANVPWPYTAEDAHTFIAMAQDRLLPRFLITVPGAGGARLIGGCGLSLLDGEVNLGYWIAPGEWGRGFGTEAARAVLGLAHALGHRRVVASHYIDNAASGRVLEKVGFRRTGRVVERFSKGRGFASPSREYEVLFESSGDSPGDCDGDDAMNRRRAA